MASRWQFSAVTLVTSVFIGCAEGIPPSQTAIITQCERPETIDVSEVGTFEVLFDGIDPRSAEVVIEQGATTEITGSLLLKPEFQTPGASMKLVIGYRPILDGVTDWHTPPCEFDEKVEWSLGNQVSLVRETLVSRIEGTKAVDLQPGPFELRFFAIKENFATDDLPVVFFIADGRMTVSPREN